MLTPEWHESSLCQTRESGHLVFVVAGCVGDSASSCGMTGLVVSLGFSWPGMHFSAWVFGVFPALLDKREPMC